MDAAMIHAHWSADVELPSTYKEACAPCPAPRELQLASTADAHAQSSSARRDAGSPHLSRGHAPQMAPNLAASGSAPVSVIAEPRHRTTLPRLCEPRQDLLPAHAWSIILSGRPPAGPLGSPSAPPPRTGSNPLTLQILLWLACPAVNRGSSAAFDHFQGGM